jgi:hypothetical protein
VLRWNSVLSRVGFSLAWVRSAHVVLQHIVNAIEVGVGRTIDVRTAVGLLKVTVRRVAAIVMMVDVNLMRFHLSLLVAQNVGQLFVQTWAHHFLGLFVLTDGVESLCVHPGFDSFFKLLGIHAALTGFVFCFGRAKVIFKIIVQLV